MSRFKDFDAAASERSDDPITFVLGGREWAVPHLNAHSYFMFTRKMSEGGIIGELALDDYFTSVLAKDDREAWHQMLAEKDIQMPTLMELVQWLVEETSGHPTNAVSPSPSTQSGRGQQLKVVSPSKGSTSKAQRSAAG
jgi:hypothetical protein